MIAVCYFKHLPLQNYQPVGTRGCFHPELWSNKQWVFPHCRHKCNRDKPASAEGCPPPSAACYPGDLEKTWPRWCWWITQVIHPSITTKAEEACNTSCVSALHSEKWAPSVRTFSGAQHRLCHGSQCTSYAANVTAAKTCQMTAALRKDKRPGFDSPFHHPERRDCDPSMQPAKELRQKSCDAALGWCVLKWVFAAEVFTAPYTLWLVSHGYRAVRHMAVGNVPTFPVG